VAGCFPAEPTSVLVQHNKSQTQTLYLQLVEKSSHVQIMSKHNFEYDEMGLANERV
jgi:hypothetical protein